MEKVILSISLLVSNRIDTIRKCMESIKPLLCAVSSELIVVDTVGEENSDGSLAVAREYATKVVHFDWCNDFAAARNAGLKLAEGEWFMFLDDDEWFEDVSEIIVFFSSGQYKNYKSAMYQIRNYTDLEGKKYVSVSLGRMVEITKKLTFMGRIHETFSERKLPCKEFSAYVHHFGYVYKNEEEKYRHQKRNTELLKGELEKEPTNMRYRTQMAQELATYDNEKALAFCEETFCLCEAEKQNNNFQWQLSLLFRLYEALGVDGITADAKYMGLKERYGYNETAEMAISYQMVRIHIINNTPEKAKDYALQYFEALRSLKGNPGKKQQQMAVDFERYQEEATYLEMLHFGAYCAYRAKEYDMAWEWYSQMPWEEKGFDNEEAFFLMVQLFQENQKTITMIKILKRIMQNEYLVGKSEVREAMTNVLALIK